MLYLLNNNNIMEALVPTTDIFKSVPVKIRIKGSVLTKIKVYLKIYLANENLSDREIDVAAQLVMLYATYTYDGIKEPYSSQLLFSTDTRMIICKELDMSGQHLTNTLGSLSKKNVVAMENKKYRLNPELVPSTLLTFDFTE